MAHALNQPLVWVSIPERLTQSCWHVDWFALLENTFLAIDNITHFSLHDFNEFILCWVDRLSGADTCRTGFTVLWNVFPDGKRRLWMRGKCTSGSPEVIQSSFDMLAKMMSSEQQTKSLKAESRLKDRDWCYDVILNPYASRWQLLLSRSGRLVMQNNVHQSHVSLEQHTSSKYHMCVLPRYTNFFCKWLASSRPFLSNVGEEHAITRVLSSDTIAAFRIVSSDWDGDYL